MLAGPRAWPPAWLSVQGSCSGVCRARAQLPSLLARVKRALRRALVAAHHSCSPLLLLTVALRRAAQIIYIAPLKALVRERIEDWSKGLCRQLGKTMVELTGAGGGGGRRPLGTGSGQQSNQTPPQPPEGGEVCALCKGGASQVPLPSFRPALWQGGAPLGPSGSARSRPPVGLLFLLLVLSISLPASKGDYTPDLKALLAADIIICTPEKWDGISRNWQARGYVRKVSGLSPCGQRLGAWGLAPAPLVTTAAWCSTQREGSSRARSVCISRPRWLCPC